MSIIYDFNYKFRIKVYKYDLNLLLLSFLSYFEKFLYLEAMESGSHFRKFT